MPDEPTPESPSIPAPSTPAPSIPAPSGPTAFAPPPSFIQSPPPNQQYTPQHVVPIQHVVPPTPVTQRDSASWGPGALVGLFVWNTAAVSYWALNKYWLDNSFGDDWWSLFYAAGAVMAIFGLVLVRTGPAGARFFGFMAGVLGCLPLLHTTFDTSISTKNFVTNILTTIIVPAVLGITALVSQPRNR